MREGFFQMAFCENLSTTITILSTVQGDAEKANLAIVGTEEQYYLSWTMHRNEHH